MDLGAQRAADSTAPAAKASLTEADLLDLAGESELEAVSTLILREQEISSLDPALFSRLSACEILSLSNNAICSLAPCSSMLQLQVLNINFNRISDLRPLAQCVELRQLFASNNKISSITPLGRCMRLSSLSLFRNQLSSLDAAINVLRTLPSLTELDLGSNPCALGPPYRHRLVRELNLKTLDGDSLTELDADLAADFFSESPLMPPVEALRPATAACASHPTAGFERPGTAVRRARPGSAPSSPMKLGGSEGAGGSSTTRLFRDPFLDSNPILLQYLAEAEAEKGRAAEASSSDGVGECSRGANGPSGGADGSASVLSLRRPLVERLRDTAAAMDSAASVSPEELASQPMFQASTCDALAGETPEQQSIRQLLLRVQELTAERDGLARLNMGSPDQAATESERPSGPPPAAIASELALLARGLPSDWSAVPCATGQGRFFYRNASLGLAQWQRPGATAEPAVRAGAVRAEVHAEVNVLKLP